MSESGKYPVGLMIPLQRGNNGFFRQNYTTLDQAYTNIKNLLFTMTGERRLNVNFGSQLYKYVFEQMTSEEELIDVLTNHISNQLKLYFPYVSVTNLNVQFSDYSMNRLDIKMEFKLKNSNNPLVGAPQTKTLEININVNN